MFCPHCGNEVKDGAVFCTKCGGRLQFDTEAPAGEGAASSEPSAQDQQSAQGQPVQPQQPAQPQAQSQQTWQAPVQQYQQSQQTWQQNAGAGQENGTAYTYRPNPGYNPGNPNGYPGGQNTVKSSKSKLVAGLLGIFLGGFGAHNFYLGKTSRAIAQIVVTVVTCGAGSIWGLIEGILCLCGNYTDADGLPLSD